MQFQLLVNLCLQGRAIEAEPLLTRVKTLTETLGMEADLKRVVWLEGKVAAGVGRAADAENAFEEVRSYFAAEKLGFDYALVCLDLALLLLEQGRTAKVRTLATEMAWILTTQGAHREAMAALRIFCDAARQDEATIELARKMVRFLHRSQHDPELTHRCSSQPEPRDPHGPGPTRAGKGGAGGPPGSRHTPQKCRKVPRKCRNPPVRCS